MQHDLSPNLSPFSSLLIVWACERQGSLFLAKVWVMLVEMSKRVRERSKVETAFTKNLDLNNLESNLLKQHWAPFCSSLGTIL